ncbi:hypothetical protein MBANPS3_002278 [Mucor bainieri]
MDLKYLLCEPVSKLAVKANEQAAVLMHQTNQQQNHDWHSITMYPTVITKQQDWNQQQLLSSSPKSVCSSLSTCSSTSSNSSNEDYIATPGRSNSFSSLRAPIPQYHHQHQQEQSRRRTASDSSKSQTTLRICRTPWTPFEDHLLQQGYDQGLSWAMISSTYLPHRSRGCCWGRFKTLQNKNMVDPNHTHMRHFRRPWKAIDFSNNSKKQQQHGI